jgi:N-acetylglucosamine kinase-like BadF-type ATPase
MVNAPEFMTSDSKQTLAGIDGGGTRTRLALAHGDGRVFGFAETGCCSFVELGREQAQQALEQLWRCAWQSADSSPRAVDALFIGTGSILSQGDAATNCEMAISLGLAASGNILAGNDVCNALAGALGARPGLLLICGTGSVCYGRNANGESHRAGGWGHLLDDRGSAHWIGWSALIAATRAADGRGEPSALTELVLDKLRLSDMTEIYRKVHHDGVPRAEIAAWAPHIISVAEAGDGVANKIVESAVAGLVEMVAAVAGRLEFQQFELALTGGLISNAASFRTRFLDRLAIRFPRFRVAEDGLEPVFGAVLLACEKATGLPPSPAFLENLRQTARDWKS